MPKVELAIGDRIVRGQAGRPVGTTGRIGLFVERNGVIFAASTMPVTGALEPAYVIEADERLAPIGRSSELRERLTGAGAGAGVVISSAELISVIALSDVEPVRSIRDNRLAVPQAVPVDESFDCPALLLRGGATAAAKGRVRDARAYARLRLSPGAEPVTCGDLIEVAPADGRSFGQSGDSGALVKLASDELLGLLLGAAPDGTGLVAPLHTFLGREGFKIYPYARIRAESREALFSPELDRVIETLGSGSNLDDVLVEHAQAIRSHFAARALTDTPRAVTAERERFVRTAVSALDAAAVQAFVHRLEKGPLALERAGLDWFLELLFAHAELVEIEKVERGEVSGRLRGTPFTITNWLERRDPPQASRETEGLSAGVTAAADRGGENTPGEVAAAVGDGTGWR